MRLVLRSPVVVIICALICLAAKAQAIDITASGAWALTIGAGDLTPGAGSDLTSTYESAVDEVLITISNTAAVDDNWRVDVMRTDGTWHGDFALYVQRTGSGTGSGSISGGLAYQEVGTTDAAFYSGAGDRTGVPIQLKLTGVSVQVPPNIYSTTVMYTVVDT
jgi:hypothetical protein